MRGSGRVQPAPSKFLLNELLEAGSGTKEEVRHDQQSPSHFAHRRSGLTVAATLIVGSAFAADGDNGKSKRRGNNGQFKTGTFQIVVPKADRGGSGGKVAKFLPPKADRGGSGRQVAKFVAPKADRGNSGPVKVFSLPPNAPRADGGSTTAQFVVPKADRGNSSGPGKVFSLPPKAPRADGGSTTAQIVAPKAPRGDGPVVATAEQPKFTAPQLLAPPTASAPAKVEQVNSAPAPVETKAAPAVVASETAAPAPAAAEASAPEVELAYTRAAQRYGYGDYEGGYENYDQGYEGGYTGGSYGDDGCY
jgi:hypothetical protein